MRQTVIQLLRWRWSLAAVGSMLIVAIACCLFWPEPAEVKVRRLLDELKGDPPARFSFFGGPRAHAQIYAELDGLGSKAMPALLETLEQSPEGALRCFAIEQLSKVGDWRTVLPLIRALDDPNGAVQRVAATALGVLRARAAVDSLVTCLASGDASLRCCAAASLGQIGDRRAFEALASRVEDSELNVRRATVEALTRLDDPRAVEYLIAALEDDESPWVRGLAVQGLMKFEDPAAIPALREACHDISDHVQDEARRALSLLGRKCRGQLPELSSTTATANSSIGVALP